MKDTESFPAVASNINLLWAALFVEELIRHDITDFCIAPGSRSTPLTLAAANHKKANTHLHFDERGLGFFALGLTQATKKPVVIISTSGSAVANLYPAVIEAKQSGQPLIIISADRPAELLNCGANQAINQHGIFASYPLYFAQIPQPSTEIKANYLLTTLDDGLNKQHNQSGPIHFNFAFAEPLYPSNEVINYQGYLNSLKKWQQNGLPFTQIIQRKSTTLAEQTELTGKKVLVVLGKMESAEQSEAVVLFCKHNCIPLFADIQSSQSGASNNFTYYDLLLVNNDFTALLEQAELIMQFGEQLVSKRLLSFMGEFSGQLHLVKSGDQRIDPNHQLDKRFDCHAIDWINAQSVQSDETTKNWFTQLQQHHTNLATKVIEPFLNEQPFSEITLIEQLDKLLIKGSPLFIGNSMPIRIADMLMKNKQANIFTNRGASGIDGIVATAIGIAKKSTKACTLLIGDTSFLYDLNSLALLTQLDIPFIIIVINNDGGAIFNMLPVPKQQKTDFYQLPHGLNFKASCEQFAVDYHNPNQLHEFATIYNQALQGKNSLIEITLQNQQTATQLEQLREQVKYATL